MPSHTIGAHLAIMRWVSAIFFRLIAVTFFPTQQSQVRSMPFIISRGAYSAQLQNEPAEQCVGDWKSKGMGHTILEGWTVPAVGMGMFVLVVVSGILSGLTLGLVSIDITRLHVLSVSGTPKQRRMANTILPVKKYPYFLLCSLLIASVLVNEMLPIMNTKLFGESYKALFISAALVIVFGEIIPQAVFPRYALELGSAMIWLVYLCMFVCCIPAAVLSGALYYTLRGAGTTQTMFTADELITFIEFHSEDHMNGNGGPLETRTVALIRNIVEAQEKVVGDVTRTLDTVFMVNGQSELNKELLQKLLSPGYSKIPVYETSAVLYEDSGLPKMRFLGYLQSRKLCDVDLEITKHVRDIGLTPLPIIDKDRSLYDALAILRSGNARMALIADPAREVQTELESTQRFYHGQYTNPRIQLEVGMGHSTLDYFQNGLLWSDHPNARHKEILGIITMENIMRALLGKVVDDPRNSHFAPVRRKSYEWRNGEDADISTSTSRLSGVSFELEKCSTNIIAFSDPPREPQNKTGDPQNDIFDIAPNGLYTSSICESITKSHNSGINNIIQLDGTDDELELDGELGSTTIGREHSAGNLRRRFSFEDGIDEKCANLLEKAN